MNCDKAASLLGAYHDGELTDIVHVLELESHLEDCADCAARLEALRSLGQSLREKAAYHKAPTTLKRKIDSAVRIRARERQPRSWQRSAFGLGGGLALAAALMLVVLLPRTDDRLGSELVANHVRSLQASHLFDIASSSRHTVKPWFQGKVDFSPAVPDLAAAGFPLVGGRLDYLDGKPCVALVYKRFKHVINVFVVRDPVDGSVEDSEGFHVVHWRVRELNYWAVSDLNTAELRQFASEFASAAKE
jgi:anti-sigma factor RsiW